MLLLVRLPGFLWLEVDLIQSIWLVKYLSALPGLLVFRPRSSASRGCLTCSLAFWLLVGFASGRRPPEIRG